MAVLSYSGVRKKTQKQSVLIYLFSVCGILTARKNNQMEVIDYAHDCKWTIMNLSVWRIWTQSDFTSGVIYDWQVTTDVHCWNVITLFTSIMFFFQYL